MIRATLEAVDRGVHVPARVLVRASDAVWKMIGEAYGITRAVDRAAGDVVRLAAVTRLHRSEEIEGLPRACMDGECDHRVGRYDECPMVPFTVCKGCANLLLDTTHEVSEYGYPDAVMWPCETAKASRR